MGAINNGVVTEVQHPDDDPDTVEETDRLVCEMRHCGAEIGPALFVSPDGSREAYHFVRYFAVVADTDAEATRFCEDCFSWLQDVAPAIQNPVA